MPDDHSVRAPRTRVNGSSRRMRVVSELDFKKAFRAGSRARSTHLIVVANENSAGCSRLGLSVGRRIWRSSPARNRLKRIVREAFRLEYDALPVGLDLVIVPAAPGVMPTLEAARKELVYLSHKAARRLAERRAGEALELGAGDSAKHQSGPATESGPRVASDRGASGSGARADGDGARGARAASPREEDPAPPPAGRQET